MSLSQIYNQTNSAQNLHNPNNITAYKLYHTIKTRPIMEIYTMPFRTHAKNNKMINFVYPIEKKRKNNLRNDLYITSKLNDDSKSKRRA